MIGYCDIRYMRYKTVSLRHCHIQVLKCLKALGRADTDVVVQTQLMALAVDGFTACGQGLGADGSVVYHAQTGRVAPQCDGTWEFQGLSIV